MIIEVTMPDGELLDVTLPDGLSDEEIQKEVDGVEAAYLLDANPDYLSSNATSERQANAPVRAGQPTQVKMPIGGVGTPAVTEVQLETLKTPLGMIGNNEVTEVQREMLETARRKSTRGGIAEREQQSAIKQARGQALKEEGETLFPYLRKARAEGTDEEMGALKDVAAMVPRGYVTLQELYANDGYVNATPKTSEEYFNEGSTAKGILASPTFFPSTLAALATGGMSIPTQIGAQVAVNAPLMEDYGGEDLTLDAIISLLPAGLSLVAGKVRSAGVASLRKALAAKGVHDAPASVLEEAYDMWSGKEAGRQIRGQAEEGLRGLVDATRAEKSLLPKPKMVNPQVLPKSSLLKNLVPVSPEDLLGPVGMDLDLVRRLISESTRGVGNSIKRTEAEAVEALAKVDRLEAMERTLREKMSTGPYDPEKYKAEIISALGDAADVPEILEAAKFALTPQARDLRGAGLRMLLSDTPDSYRAVLESGNAAQAVPLGEGLAALHTGHELEKGLTRGAGAKGWVTEPVVSAAKVASSSHPAVFRAGELLLRGARPGAASPLLPYRGRLAEFYGVGNE